MCNLRSWQPLNIRLGGKFPVMGVHGTEFEMQQAGEAAHIPLFGVFLAFAPLVFLASDTQRKKNGCMPKPYKTGSLYCSYLVFRCLTERHTLSAALRQGERSLASGRCFLPPGLVIALHWRAAFFFHKNAKVLKKCLTFTEKFIKDGGCFCFM